METLTKIPLETAVEELLKRTPEPSARESVALPDALGRFSFLRLTALTDTPPFDNSPVDGFALRHADIAGASADCPAVLRVAGTFYAGDAPERALEPGTCARVMTGAPLPPGATCVVRYEDTDNGEEYVRIPLSLREHQNYRFQGEDIRKGGKLIGKGDRITPSHIGVLAGQGYTEIPVFIRPKVGILSTGSELVPGGRPLEPGKIYDSNRYMLGAKTAVLGGEPVLPPHTADELETIAEALRELTETCDLVISTGGVSVGDRDYMPAAGRLVKAEPVFRGVQMKPGGWITALCRGTALILCLSGNPGAASLSFDLLAAPVIRRLAGAAQVLPRRTRCALQEPFAKTGGERRFLYALFQDGAVKPSSTGFVSSSPAFGIGSNCILDIPAGTPTLSAGDSAEIILL
ncbi:MAG: molybdopterin molybdotransferase MoeA [Spirochaetaceae bacterium]|nr:molybdopterin molybdotransferase MoeA [Spirochaetaceae bacterium]